MRIFRPLRDRRIALLFTGQVLSCVGDEVYNVAMVWFAVSLIGERAGYLSALQAAAVLVFSLVGGVFADRQDQRRVLIWADAVRGSAVLIPVVLSFFTPMSLAILVPVALLESCFTGLFYPALRSLVPEIVTERALLNATNGLVEATIRLGRVIGPGFVAIIGPWLPLIHFFSIDALTFLCSALCFLAIGPVPHPTPPPTADAWRQMKDGLLAGARSVWDSPPLRFTFLTGLLSSPPWYLVMPLSMALLVHSRMPKNYGALGMFIAAYGVGNVIGTLWGGSVEMKHPERFQSWGRFIAGVGFFAMAFTKTLPEMMGAAAFAAMGGPLSDLGFLALVQNRFRGIDAVRIFRFNIAFLYTAILIAFSLSPLLFRTFGISAVIGGCGVCIAVSGFLGIVRFPSENPPAADFVFGQQALSQ